ncbi:M28 family peptidase [Pseudonocardia sp. C8]|uniref:M28 family peptidase n=1 Tax=Pseudonocardia sp. C8 TaxID=2762759 RepID=UPI001642ABF8|nr:M28 family peptidase [Pseudonocardia sp. C8]MBC3192665.1 M28 family peptidase [Pseudonocardia sp. C8]
MRVDDRPRAGGGTGRRRDPAGSGTGRRGRAAGLAGLVALALVVGAAWTVQRPPAPVPASAPATEFSAERALTHLRAIAGTAPTPIGSAGGDAVRDHLVAELTALGLDVDVDVGVGVHPRRTGIDVGRVENVVATLPGRSPTGRVVLAAHYDTTAGSPGASDDKSAVAAILETVRAVTRGAPLRNDVVVLLTDGEEPGMLGASAFTARHPYGAQGGVVLNAEAVGNRGPSVLFETGPGNAALLDEYARSAPSPVADSGTAALYAMTDSLDTDFTVLREAGFTGLNLALLDGNAAYHHPLDTVDRLDPRSLQHQGATMLGLARGFGQRDLAAFGPGPDALYVTVFGQVVRYPAAWALPLAGAALVAVAGFAVLARRRGLVTVPGAAAGTVAALVVLVAAPAAAIGLWELLVALRPGYGALFMGDPYRPAPYRWALGTLTAAVVLGCHLLVRRRTGPAAPVLGALIWTAVLGVACAVLAPGLAFHGTFAAAAAAAGAIVAVLAGPSRPWVRAAASALGAVPGAVLLVGGGTGLLGILGVAGGAAATIFFALAGLLVLPLVEQALPARRAGRTALPGVALALTAALTAAGLIVDRVDADHPEPASLTYVLDAGAGRAGWVSRDTHPHPWTAGYAPDRAGDDPAGLPLPYGATPRRTGAAPVLPLPAPDLTVLGARADGAAVVLDLRLASARDPDVVVLHADRPVERATITLAGLPAITSAPTGGGDRGWPFELRVHDPPAGGAHVTLRVPGAEPPRLAVGDHTVGLERVPGFTARPPGLARSPAHDSDLLVVGRLHQPATVAPTREGTDR